MEDAIRALKISEPALGVKAIVRRLGAEYPDIDSRAVRKCTVEAVQASGQVDISAVNAVRLIQTDDVVNLQTLLHAGLDPKHEFMLSDVFPPDDNALAQHRTHYLELASGYKALRCMKALIDARADLEQTADARLVGTDGKRFDVATGLDATRRLTALQSAVNVGNVPSAKLLVQAGARVDAGISGGGVVVAGAPLHAAVECNRDELVSLLLRANASPVVTRDGWTALHAAARSGAAAAMVALLAFPEARKCVNVPAAEEGGAHPLYVASLRGDVSIVSMLLDAGAHIDQQRSDGKTPLYVAITHGHTAVADCLLGASADPDSVDGDGVSLLQAACSFKQPDAVRLLTRASADIEGLSSYGVTPLMVAAEADCSGSILALLDAGAKLERRLGPNQRKVDPSKPSWSDQADNALMSALTMGNANALRVLLERGASTDHPLRARLMAVLSKEPSGAHTECCRLIDEAVKGEVDQQRADARTLRCEDRAREACAYCGASAGAGLRLKRCGACNSVSYCSASCQKADWKRGHKFSCASKAPPPEPISEDSPMAVGHLKMPDHLLRAIPGHWRLLHGGKVRVSCIFGADGSRLPPLSDRAARRSILPPSHPSCAGPATEQPQCLFLQLALSLKIMTDESGLRLRPGLFDARDALIDIMKAEGFRPLEKCNHRVAFYDSGSDGKAFKAKAKAAAASLGLVVELAHRRVDPGQGLLVDYPECCD